VVFERKAALRSDALEGLLGAFVVECNATFALAADKVVMVLLKTVGDLKDSGPYLLDDADFEKCV